MSSVIATIGLLALLAYVLPSLIATRSSAVAARPDDQIETDPLAVGFRLGPYEIERELVPALLGRVYKARDLRYGGIVAINVLEPSLRDEVGRFRFIMSARAAAVFTNSMLALSEEGGIPFAVLKYVDGVGPTVDIGRVPWRRRTKG